MSNPKIIAYTIGINTKGFEIYPCDMWLDPTGIATRKQEEAKVYTDKLVAEYFSIDMSNAKVEEIIAEVEFDMLAKALAHYYNVKDKRLKVTELDMHSIVSDYMHGMDEPVPVETIAEHFKQSILNKLN